MNKKILCIGELLWDSLPAGLFLGGAPFNVACHLHMLGLQSLAATRVGKDILGQIVLSRLTEKGVSTEYIQVDESIPTGIVHAKLDVYGNASYDIVKPSAWDYIKPDTSLMEAAEDCDAVVFGSLAQRSEVSAETIHKVLDKGRLNIFDVNLRPPFDNRDIVEKSLYKSSIVKLNDHEIVKLAEWFNLASDIKDAAESLSEKFGCSTICITMGEEGAILFKDGRWFQHPGYKVNVVDTIGAGDAFLAALIKTNFENKTGDEMLAEANTLGAYVASKAGATPGIVITELKRINKPGENL